MATLEQLDQKLDDLKELVFRLVAVEEKQNDRINALERWRAYVVGISVTVAVFIERIFH